MSDLTIPPPFLTRSDVARHLDIPLSKLTWWLWALDEGRRYDEFEINRRSGGPPRRISAPIKPIKDLQRRFAETLTACYAPRLHVHGFVKARSPITNARFHRNKRWVLRVDLTDFFPSINFGRVRGMFLAFPFEYPPDVATLLAQLCCHRGGLPQGAPTSPIISNFICRSFDKRLAQLAMTHHCHYTRYADDLSFSTGRLLFPAPLALIQDGIPVVGPALAEAVRSNGFRVNETKTRLMPRTQRQRVTGLVVNEGVNIPREYLRGLRDLLYIWEKHGEPAAIAAFNRKYPERNWPAGKPEPEFRRVVRGRVEYIRSVRGHADPTYLSLARALSRRDSSYVVLSVPVDAAPPATVRFYTEGPTDVLHIAAAVEYLHSIGEFQDLHLIAAPDYVPKNDKSLLDQLKSLALTPQRQPCIGVFDRDSELVATEIGPSGWLNLTNGVAGVALAAPPWRKADEPICIEMLFPSDVLARTDASGRRLFLREEFSDTGVHNSRHFMTPIPKSRTLVRDSVIEIESDESVALSKMDFARATSGREAPYGDIDYVGFRPTFERVDVVVKELWEDIG